MREKSPRKKGGSAEAEKKRRIERADPAPAVEPREEEGSSATRPGRREPDVKVDESGADVE